VRVAVTGGSGFVGIHTVRALKNAGHEIVVVARGTVRRPKGDRVTFVQADLTDSPKLAEAFAGCDAVVHLVAVINQRGRQTFDRVNREGTERVVAAAKQAQVGHLVHQGALGSDPDPRYPYLLSKWAGEQAVRAGGVPYTALRPGLIFGPGDGFFTLLTRMMRINPIVPIAGNGRTLFQPISVDDVTRCIVLALERGPSNKVHELGGPDQMSYEEIVLTIKNSLGMHRKLVHIPVPMMMPPAFMMEKVLRHPPVTRDQLKMLAKNNITRTDSVRVAFGFDAQSFADNCGYLQDY
jgi:nucleoside-diphosphate-sugar epimerase